MKHSRRNWTRSLHQQKPCIKRKANMVREYLETIVLFKKRAKFVKKFKTCEFLDFLDVCNRFTMLNYRS